MCSNDSSFLATLLWLSLQDTHPQYMGSFRDGVKQLAHAAGRVKHGDMSFKAQKPHSDILP